MERGLQHVHARLDSIEETAIQTSNYSAEFGQAGGARFQHDHEVGNQPSSRKRV